MGKYYTYKSDYKNEDGLHAFSISDDGRLYYYNFDSTSFRESFDLKDKFILPKESGYAGNLIFSLVILANRRRRKKAIRQYYEYIINNRLMDSVLYYRAERRLAVYEITRVTSLKEYKDHTVVHYRYNDYNDKERIGVIDIQNINNYDDLISELKSFCERTKDLCANCGCFMFNGVCPKCGGNDVKIENKKLLTGFIVMGIIGSLLFVLALIGFNIAGANNNQTLSTVSLITLAVGFVIATCGIGYYYQKKK